MKTYIYLLILLLLVGCSTKRNNFFTRQYHGLTTRYNVYFNGNEAFESGLQKMALNHREDYTNLIPVFVSFNETTRNLATSDMDYAIEKAIKAIDKHSITAKPKRKKNKDSQKYLEFRKKKEYNNKIPECYLLLGKAYFYKKKYAMANNTFRYIMRQYPDDEELLTEVRLWLFRSNTEMGRYDEAEKDMALIDALKLKGKQKELFAATKTDYYIRKEDYPQAIRAGEILVKESRNFKRTSRYNFLLSQLYLKENRDSEAMAVLKKITGINLNFNYEMIFNAQINMALAYQEGDESLKKKLRKMLKDVKNDEYQDRIYYALASIEEKQGNEKEAVDYYWKSVHASVSNDNQKSLSFLKLGEYYFENKDYIAAQSAYDSCMYFMDTRVENYESLKVRVTHLTDLVKNLNTIYTQDSLQRLAAMSVDERNQLIDEKIREITDAENKQKEEERLSQSERNFYYSNDMINRSGSASTQSSNGDWYFYNPVTVSLGKNEFKRKWGRRRLEDNWRRMNKSMVDPVDSGDQLAEGTEIEEEKVDLKSRDYYLRQIPLTQEKLEASEELIEKAYYSAGESYLYVFNDPEKALECFENYIKRYPDANRLPQVYYLAYFSADQLGQHEKAADYKNRLINNFPDSELAKGLVDPDYFRKSESELEVVNKRYADAFDLYTNIYYEEALTICNDILKKYPDTKLKVNVLFLRAMCMLNLSSDAELRVALNDVLDAKPGKEINEVVSSILASMNVGSEPVAYSSADMANSRFMKSNRNWEFSDDPGGDAGDLPDESPYRVNKNEKHRILFVLPGDIKNTQVLQIYGRLVYVNAGDIVGGRNYKTEREKLWYKTDAISVGTFQNYDEASKYLTRAATDRVILKNLGNEDYRILAITEANLDLLKRLKNLDEYLEFFVKNYFDDTKTGEAMTGIRGTSAHLFVYEEETEYDFVLMLPFQRINMKRIANIIHLHDPAFALERETYDDDYEFLVTHGVGNQDQALEYMNNVMQNEELYSRIKNIEHRFFVITPDNLKVLQDGKYIDEYMGFFTDNFLRSLKGETGIEEGDFIYNKDVDHRFVLLYSNKIDPFRLKAEFEKINVAGLKLNNDKYDNEYDCLIVSGFKNRETAMRYFNAAIKDNNLLKPLRNTNYRNFIISNYNYKVMLEKKLADPYLLFFKKYYLDRPE